MPRSSTAATRCVSAAGCATVMARFLARWLSGRRNDGPWRRGLVDVDPEVAALDVGLLLVDLVNQVLRNAAGNGRVDLGQRCTTLGEHAEVLQVLRRVRAGLDLREHVVDGWRHVPDDTAHDA